MNLYALLVFLVVIRIYIRVAMQFSIAFDPNTRLTAVLFILYAHTVAAGAAPV